MVSDVNLHPYIMDIVFMCDIYINFHTACKEDGKWVFDKMRIARHYARGWLAIDVVSSVPMDLIMVGRCKLDPSLKATCFQPLNLRVHTVLST